MILQQEKQRVKRVLVSLSFYFENRRKDFYLDIVIAVILYGYESQRVGLGLYQLLPPKEGKLAISHETEQQQKNAT